MKNNKNTKKETAKHLKDSANQKQTMEHREIWEALRKSEERLQLISRATNDVLWDWNLLTNKLWWNEGVRTLFGYPEMEVGPDIRWWEENIHPDDRKRVVTGIHNDIDSGKKSWSNEYRFRKKDGSYAFIFDRGFIVRNSDGRPVRMIGSMMDVTKRKKMEKELLKAHEELEKRVKEKTAELKKTNEKLLENSKKLKKQLDELERINKIMVGRELRMKEMKEKIKELEKKDSKENNF